MTTRMLIDARHREETRVAVLKGNRIEEFDFDSAEHKQIKGNIYLAKVTRVEPSLQAAFVDYGGNRHGFLAFSEIHPDYYQIPKEDRDALLAEEAKHAEEEAALRDQEEESGDLSPPSVDDEEHNEGRSSFEEELIEENGIIEQKSEAASDDDDADDNLEEAEEEDKSKDTKVKRGRRPRRGGRKGGRAKASDEARKKRLALRRRYKIQDVIHRRQVLLVQVVKEERGNKGAALTSYLSLAGRYCVLMPNSSHGGGISRKISNGADRKRLKSIIAEMKLPKTMGCIVRTAGLSRTKTEIKRDFDYLARLWDEIREKTLGASAPQQIHSDSDLIKRAIRDIYNREIQEVLVEGADGYRAAKDFMKLLMPSHARRVKSYADPVPLFQRYGAEDQLSAMYDPVVQLKSGGYLVINPTEALVSIDINSGRSTKEHGIEQTAVATNLEAAHEIARQLRLRDMAGLVVIDFIDMDYGSNVRKVEKAMRDALKSDRARIQVGRISGFGLMEMSRQRLRTGVLEATTRICPHCDGTGLVRTASSAGLAALRLLEEEAGKGKGTSIAMRTSSEAMIYVLNHKRNDIASIEERYGVNVEILPDGEEEGAKMTVSSSGPKPANAPKFEPIVDDDEDEDDVSAVDDSDDDEKSDRPKRRRRRRGRRGGRKENRKNAVQNDGEDSSGDDSADDKSAKDSDSGKDKASEDKPKRSRRGSRGGRGRGASKKTNDDAEQAGTGEKSADKDSVEKDGTKAEGIASDGEEKPKPRRRTRKATDKKAEAEKADDGDVKAKDTKAEKEEKPKRKPRKKAEPKADTDTKADSAKTADKPVKKAAPRKRAPAKAKEDAADKTEKPARKPRKAAPKKAADSDKAQKDAAPDKNPEASNDANGGAGSKKGWWQRTFG
ncbi:ribonuclease E/G [Sphingorhabdus sp. Alg239-R122]|uniref:Rne/Rng family ribonuclease n=1 Tax=Sphingorhabdus sp. Alg239-R122 TaxID=2305989 RepID=UPI0013DCD128|nr:ribonuclease E/G [Sphingorhabdus sp. Alg239-R122]